MEIKEMADDTISRSAALDAIFSEPLYESGMKKRDADAVVPAIYEKIKSLPSAQPEIIRCKECKFYRCDGCFFSTAETEENGFCSWAERRTDG